MMTKEQFVQTSPDEFMNEGQLDFVRQLLMNMRDAANTRSIEEPGPGGRQADPIDQAWQEEQWMIRLKRRAQQTDLLTEIDKALHRVTTGEYGYCELSGEPIDVRRLLANPLSRTTVEEQDRLERSQMKHLYYGQNRG